MQKSRVYAALSYAGLLLAVAGIVGAQYFYARALGAWSEFMMCAAEITAMPATLGIYTDSIVQGNRWNMCALMGIAVSLGAITLWMANYFKTKAASC